MQIHFQDPAAFDPGLVEGPQLDPNSPELFKSNIHIAQQHVIRIQQLAQNAITAMWVSVLFILWKVARLEYAAFLFSEHHMGY